MKGGPSNDEWQWAQGRQNMVQHKLVRVCVHACAFAHACMCVERNKHIVTIHQLSTCNQRFKPVYFKSLLTLQVGCFGFIVHKIYELNSLSFAGCSFQSGSCITVEAR